MADTNTKINITIGLDQVKFGTASPAGVMPGSMTKIGMVYQNTANLSQDAAEVTEHFEEGKVVPFYRKKTKKAPVLTFSLVVDDLNQLVKTVGGSLITDEQGNVIGWGFNGDELANDAAVLAITKQGLDIEIPNGDIDAVCNEDIGGDGVFMVSVTVTPKSVDEGKKAFRRVKKATASPASQE